MFQLVVAVISIVLASSLAASAAYYGGSAYVESRERSIANALVSQSMQIKGAYTAFMTSEGRAPGYPDELVERGYLTSTSFPYREFGNYGYEGMWAFQVWGGNPSYPVHVLVISAQNPGLFTSFKRVCDQALKILNVTPRPPGEENIVGEGVACYSDIPEGRYVIHLRGTFS